MNNKLEVIGIDHGWSMMKTISQVFVTGVKSIVDKAKEKGRSALYRLSEFLGIKKRLLDIRENVRGAIKTTDKDIAKTELLAKGFREAGQTVTNAFRTFADKPEVDYSQKEQKQTEPERAEAERVEAEVVYAPMVAEPQEYQYNADAFEARKTSEGKQEKAGKALSLAFHKKSVSCERFRPPAGGRGTFPARESTQRAPGAAKGCMRRGRPRTPRC